MTIEYTGDKDDNLDARIREMIKSMGFEETGSGYHIELKTRDFSAIREFEHL